MSGNLAGTSRDHDAGIIRARPVKKPGLWVLTVAAIGFVVLVLWTLATSPNMHWDVIFSYLFPPPILNGAFVTLQLTVISEALGITLGILLAVMHLSSSRILATLSAVYLWTFRSIPLLVQLIFWFNLGLLFPQLGIPGTPFTLSTNDLINGFIAALLGLTLHEAAYQSEIVRGGILAVDSGQVEAAQSLGMSRFLSLRRIVLPQAIRVIIPPMGNQLISLLKGTSLVAFIAGGDLMTSAQNVYAANFEVVALLVVASLWYLALVSLGTFFQRRIERRFNRGIRGSASRNPRLTTQPVLASG